MSKLSLKSGNSTFRRVMDKETEPIYESPFLNYTPPSCTLSDLNVEVKVTTTRFHNLPCEKETGAVHTTLRVEVHSTHDSSIP